MKLLMISGDRNIAAGKSGAFSETLKELHCHFERIDILCPRISSPQCVTVVHGNVFVYPAPGSLLSQPSFILQKGRELYKAHHHDIMTVHDFPPFYNGLGARWLKKSIGIPAVLEIHHIIGWPKASSIQEYIGRAMSTMFLSSHTAAFDAVRVVNGAVKNFLLDVGASPEKIHIIPSFYLDHALIHASKNQQKTFDIVFCSRLVDNKGLLAVIDALEFLPEANLLIIGDGPLRKKAEQKAKKFGSRITFTGWLPSQSDVLENIASGKIFIMNSSSEGGPRVALEAMALGLPILATRVGVMPDVLRDGVNGIFTDGSAKDIATKATMLLADESRLLSIGKAAALVTQKFEKHAAVGAYADFLKSQVH